MDIKKANRVADIINNANCEIVDILGLSKVLLATIENLEPYNSRGIGIKVRDSIYDYGTGLTTLNEVIIDKLNKVSETLTECYNDNFKEDK